VKLTEDFVFQPDFGLALYNLISPKKAPGKITAYGRN